MTLALISQLGDFQPRVTHHQDQYSARMEIGTFLATGGYADDPSIILVNLNEVPDLQIGTFVANPGAFFGLIDLTPKEQWCAILHYWSESHKVHKINTKSCDDREEAIKDICFYLTEDKWKGIASEQGYYCYEANSEEFGKMFIELYAVNLREPFPSQFS